MRPLALLVLIAAPAAGFAQTKEIDDAVKAKLLAVHYVQSLRQPNGGYAPSLPAGEVKPPASLRATSAAVRAVKYLSGMPVSEVGGIDKTAEFVMSCYDPKTGGFADTPGGKPDVMLTAVGVMAAVELGVPKEKFRKAMDYLKEHAKTFEEVRLGAGAVEAWGVKDCPFDLKPWFEIARQQSAFASPWGPKDGARPAGSLLAFQLRLGREVVDRDALRKFLDEGQRADGGFSHPGEAGSDLETTYRVMRAYHLLKAAPKDPAKVREFVGKCRNTDGGYGVKPGEKSTAGGVYYAAIIGKWLDEME